MSLETWKKEFYPTEAEDSSGSVEHSLRKWIGIREENLKKHGLKQTFDNLGLVESGHTEEDFVFGWDTCSLCRKYNTPYKVYRCGGCPLVKVLGFRCFDDGQPYCTFEEDGNPEPMIKALEEALEWEKQTKRH